jgi:hypothetical protein
MEYQMYNKDLLIKISKFSDYYSQFFLVEKDKIELYLSDWYESFLFFLSRIYYQGRTDKASEKVRDISTKIIGRYFSVADKDEAYNKLYANNFLDIQNALEEEIGKGKTGKSGDVNMTISVLKYIKSISGKNIVKKTVDEIKSTKLKNEYKDLQSIFQIGPKIASMYLRDIVTLYDLNSYIPIDEFQFLQPIDTWVKKIARQLTIIDENEKKDGKIREKIVKACNENGISPLDFNSGAWYMGTHSLDILFYMLERKE